jgi:hypothetical protein
MLGLIGEIQIISLKQILTIKLIHILIITSFKSFWESRHFLNYFSKKILLNHWEINVLHKI